MILLSYLLLLAYLGTTSALSSKQTESSSNVKNFINKFVTEQEIKFTNEDLPSYLNIDFDACKVEGEDTEQQQQKQQQEGQKQQNKKSILAWKKIFQFVLNKIEKNENLFVEIQEYLYNSYNIPPQNTFQLRSLLNILLKDKDKYIDVYYHILDIISIHLRIPQRYIDLCKKAPVADVMRVVGSSIGQYRKLPNIHSNFVISLTQLQRSLKSFLNETGGRHTSAFEMLESFSFVSFPLQEYLNVLFSFKEQLEQYNSVNHGLLKNIGLFTKAMESFFNQMTPTLEKEHKWRQWNHGVGFFANAAQDYLKSHSDPTILTLPGLLRKLASKMRGEDSTLDWFKLKVGSWYHGIQKETIHKITFVFDTTANFLEFYVENIMENASTKNNNNDMFKKIIGVFDSMDIDKKHINMLQKIHHLFNTMNATKNNGNVQTNTTNSFFWNVFAAPLLHAIADDPMNLIDPNNLAETKEAMPAAHCDWEYEKFKMFELGEDLYLNFIKLGIFPREDFDKMIKKLIIAASNLFGLCSFGGDVIVTNTVERATQHINGDIGNGDIIDAPSVTSILRGLGSKIIKSADQHPRSIIDFTILRIISFISPYAETFIRRDLTRKDVITAGTFFISTGNIINFLQHFIRLYESENVDLILLQKLEDKANNNLKLYGTVGSPESAAVKKFTTAAIKCIKLLKIKNEEGEEQDLLQLLNRQIWQYMDRRMSGLYLAANIIVGSSGEIQTEGGDILSSKCTLNFMEIQQKFRSYIDTGKIIGNDFDATMENAMNFFLLHANSCSYGGLFLLTEAFENIMKELQEDGKDNDIVSFPDRVRAYAENIRNGRGELFTAKWLVLTIIRAVPQLRRQLNPILFSMEAIAHVAEDMIKLNNTYFSDEFVLTESLWTYTKKYFQAALVSLTDLDIKKWDTECTFNHNEFLQQLYDHGFDENNPSMFSKEQYNQVLNLTWEAIQTSGNNCSYGLKNYLENIYSMNTDTLNSLASNKTFADFLFGLAANIRQENSIISTILRNRNVHVSGMLPKYLDFAGHAANFVTSHLISFNGLILLCTEVENIAKFSKANEMVLMIQAIKQMLKHLQQKTLKQSDALTTSQVVDYNNNNKKKKNYSYVEDDTYKQMKLRKVLWEEAHDSIGSLLQQVHPELSISPKAIVAVVNCLAKILENFAFQWKKESERNVRRMSTPNSDFIDFPSFEFYSAIHPTLGNDELAEHAVKEMQKAKSSAQHIIFPHNSTNKYFSIFEQLYQSSKDIKVINIMIAAMMEYLSAEILELSGNIANNNVDKTVNMISVENVKTAIASDEALSNLLPENILKEEFSQQFDITETTAAAAAEEEEEEESVISLVWKVAWRHALNEIVTANMISGDGNGDKNNDNIIDQESQCSFSLNEFIAKINEVLVDDGKNKFTESTFGLMKSKLILIFVEQGNTCATIGVPKHIRAIATAIVDENESLPLPPLSNVLRGIAQLSLAENSIVSKLLKSYYTYVLVQVFRNNVLPNPLYTLWYYDFVRFAEYRGATITDSPSNIPAFVFDTFANVLDIFDLMYQNDYKKLITTIVSIAHFYKNEGLATMLQFLLKDFPSDSKEFLIEGYRIIFQLAAAAFSANSAPLGNIDPHEKGCLFFTDSIFRYEIKLDFSDNPNAFPMTKLTGMIKHLIVQFIEKGQGCGAAYVAASENRLFGGLAFPEEVLSTYWDFLFNYSHKKPKTNVNNLFNFIRATINYCRENIAILENPMTFIDNPWSGSLILKHLKIFNLEIAEVKKNPEIISKKYKELAVSLHPDKGGTNEEFVQLKEAYDGLRIAYLGDKTKSASEESDFLLGMKDTMFFIDRYSDGKNELPLNVVTSLVEFVHAEYVKRRIKKEVNQVKDISSVEEENQMARRLKERFKIPVAGKVVLQIFDVLLVPPPNVCEFSYRQAKQFHHEYRIQKLMTPFPGLFLSLFEDNKFVKNIVSKDSSVPYNQGRYYFQTQYDHAEDNFVKAICNIVSMKKHKDITEMEAQIGAMKNDAMAGNNSIAGDSNFVEDDWEYTISTFLSKNNEIPNIFAEFNPFVDYLPLIDSVWNSQTGIATINIFIAFIQNIVFTRGAASKGQEYINLLMSELISFKNQLFNTDWPLCKQVTTIVRKYSVRGLPRGIGNVDQAIALQLAQFELRAAEIIYRLEISEKDLTNITLKAINKLIPRYDSTVVFEKEIVHHVDNIDFFIGLAEAFQSDGEILHTNNAEDHPCAFQNLESFSKSYFDRLGKGICSKEVKLYKEEVKRREQEAEEKEKEEQKKEEELKVKQKKKEEELKVKQKKDEEELKVKQKKDEEASKAKQKKDEEELKSRLAAEIAGKTGERIFRYHNEKVSSIACSPTKNQAVSGSSDFSVIIWDYGNLETTSTKTLKGHTDIVTSVTWSSNGKIASSSHDGSYRVWDANSGSQIFSFETKGGGWFSEKEKALFVEFSPNNKYLATLSDETVGVQMFNVDADTLNEWKISDWRKIKIVRFSPDSKKIVTAGGIGILSKDSMVRVWSIESGKQLLEFEHKDVLSVTWSKNGELIATGTNLGEICIWKALTGEKINNRCLYSKGKDQVVNSLSFSKDNEILVSGHGSGRIFLWNINEWISTVSHSWTHVEHIQLYEGHTDEVTSVAFSNDGEYILSGSSDTTIRKWFVPYLNQANYFKRIGKKREE